MKSRNKSGIVTRCCAAGVVALGASPLLAGGYDGLFAFATDEKIKEELQGHDNSPPKMSPEAVPVPFDRGMFGPDPNYEDTAYDPKAQLDIYGAKYQNPTARPLLELGRELYQSGPFQPMANILGDKNPLAPHVFLYGDWRTAIAYNDNGNRETALLATRLNLDLDIGITGTERIHAFFRPLDRNGSFTRVELGGDGDDKSEFNLDGNVDALFFEGDVGSIWSGFTNSRATFDIPFAIGLIPLLFQNGVWVEDAFTGIAVTIPSQNSPHLQITNLDITFFAGFDKVTTGAVPGADSAVQVFGVTTFLEMMEGYWELGYGYTQDNSGFGGSYHNVTAAFTRRYGGFLSNSVRVIANFGQDPDNNAKQTADGFILLIENSLVTSLPSTLIPYFNFFAGFDRPQSLARDAGAGGVLKNTGIMFETDGLTGFPKLTDNGQDAVGGAIGIEYLFDLDKQVVFEVAGQHRHGDDGTLAGGEIGVGMRVQIPINQAMILRFDAMYAWRDKAEDLSGIRFEYRWKF
jgi:hypothetical protein